MVSMEVFWGKILPLVTASSITRAMVTEVTGARLQHVEGSSTPYYLVYESEDPPPSPFVSIELRLPIAGTSAKGEVLVLGLGDDVDARPSDVRLRFRSEPTLSPPDPRQREGALVYWRYRMRNGVVVAFGFEPARSERLRSVVVDTTERSS